MVFFTSILIVTILYYLQADGLLYVTVIALTAELVNIFMTHTVAKSVENKLKNRHKRAVQGYIARIKTQRKTIKELEKIQEDAGTKLYKANSRIKELEALMEGDEPPPPAPDAEAAPGEAPEQAEQPETPPDPENHLPAGSNRKQPPV